MQDLMAKLQEILSTPEGQQQLNSIAGMLGGNANVGNKAAPPPTAQPSNNGGFDLSALSSLLGNNQPIANDSSSGNSGGFDLSALSSLLGGAQSGQGSTAPTGDSGIPGIDMGMIMNIQRMVAGMNVNDKNTQLLNALKPHFSEKRRARVDQAISIMRMISLMPMLKETGILKGIL